MKAIRIVRNGGAEVLQLVDVETPQPEPDEILIKHAAIGVNYIDTYHRTGLYPVALPSGLGLEGAGVISSVGSEVTSFRAGDRVAYCTGPIGAYAESHVVPASRAVKLPDAIALDIAAASMLKGLTACFLLKRTYVVKPGTVCVIYAAAGGVGQIVVQWAKRLGARVIAVVGASVKAEIARQLGADDVIVSSEETVSERVRQLTKGVGADVVYDSIGKDTFDQSLDSLRPTGMLVTFGNASGPPPDISPATLAKKGSLFLTRPTLFDYARSRGDLEALADDLFKVIGDGAVRIASPQHFRLAEATQAHRQLESRANAGSIVITP
jgi:NADPH:quinone reductase